MMVSTNDGDIPNIVGTLSPMTMDARTDGSLNHVELASDGDQILGRFSRYTREDALCCPSAISTVTYRIAGAESVLTRVSTTTEPTSPAPGSSGPSPVQVPAR